MKVHHIESSPVTIRAGDTLERRETWHVWITAYTSDDRPITPYNRAAGYHVHAEREPDAICAEVATTTPAETGRSLGHARARAREFLRVLACGAGINCPGIVACIDGAPCPYGVKPAT